MSSILNRIKIKKLKSRLSSIEVFDPEVDSHQCVDEKTLALIRGATKTSIAYHDLADVADNYVKEIETRIELGHKIPEADLRFMSEFTARLTKI